MELQKDNKLPESKVRICDKECSMFMSSLYRSTNSLALTQHIIKLYTSIRQFRRHCNEETQMIMFNCIKVFGYIREVRCAVLSMTVAGDESGNVSGEEGVRTAHTSISPISSETVISLLIMLTLYKPEGDTYPCRHISWHNIV